MPNILTSIFVSSPATEPVEAPHPNTGVYVTGTQATAGGPWTVTHTLVSKTTTPLTMVGRLKNFPTVTVAVVATGGPNAGNIFNTVLAAPTGLSLVPTSSTTIGASWNSVLNNSGYLLERASNSTFTTGLTTVYAGPLLSFSNTALTASTGYYYRVSTTGAGFYDSSVPSTPPVLGTTPAPAASATTLTPQTSDYAFTAPNADLTSRPFPSSLAEYTINTDATALTVNVTTNSPYTGSVAVFVNNVWNQQVTTVSGSGVSSDIGTTRTGSFPITLPAGTKNVSFDIGAVGRDDAGGFGYFWQSMQVVLPAGAALTARPWVKQTGEFIGTLSDSIGVEATCIPGQGWLNQLRRLASRATSDLVALGYGGASPLVLIGTAAARTTIVNQYAALSAGYAKKRFVVALGTNMNAGFDGPALQTALVALGNALVAGVPGFVISNLFIQIVPPNASPNTTDYSTYRTAQNNAATTLGARAVDAFAGLVPNSSGIHFDTPTTSTVNTTVAGRYDAALVDTTTPAPPSNGGFANAETFAWTSAVATAGGTLFTGMGTAVDNMITSLKNAGVYSKVVAFYPFGCANLAGAALNLINPANTDAALRLTFTGSPVVGLRGLSSSTATGTFANTNLVPSVSLDPNGFAAGAYLSELGNTAASDAMFGVSAVSGANTAQLTMYPSAGGVLYWLAQLGAVTPTATRARGFYFGRKNGAAIGVTINNLTQGTPNWSNTANADLSMSTLPVYLLCNNNKGVASDFTLATLGCAIFTNSLDLPGANALNTAVGTFIGNMGRS